MGRMRDAAQQISDRYRHDFAAFSKEVIGTNLWDKQEEILRSLVENQYTVVKSCYGSGKSYTAAHAALSYLYTHAPSKVVVTSSSWTQVEKIIFAEVLMAHKRSKVPLGGTTKQTSLVLDKDWFMMGVSPKIDVDSEAYRFEGYHSPNVLVILDQAQGVHPKLWDVAKALVTTKSSRILALGNPISPSGVFYDACIKKELWNEITISAFDTPNVKAGEELIPGLVTTEWVQARKIDWGETNPMYISKVHAQFPEESDDILIPLTWVEMARGSELSEDGAKGLGVDVARFGTDLTVFTVVKGQKVVEIKSYQGKDTMQTAGWTKKLMERYGIPDSGVCIDDTGLGGGVTDRLHEDGFYVNGINNQSKAEDSEHFFNLSAEMHWHMRRTFETNGIQIPDHPGLLSQLSGRKYEVTSKGKGQIKIESKDDMKKRGLKSPDFADSLVLALKAQQMGKDMSMGPSVTII